MLYYAQALLYKARRVIPCRAWPAPRPWQTCFCRIQANPPTTICIAGIGNLEEFVICTQHRGEQTKLTFFAAVVVAVVVAFWVWKPSPSRPRCYYSLFVLFGYKLLLYCGCLEELSREMENRRGKDS